MFTDIKIYIRAVISALVLVCMPFAGTTEAKIDFAKIKRLVTTHRNKLHLTGAFLAGAVSATAIAALVYYFYRPKQNRENQNRDGQERNRDSDIQGFKSEGTEKTFDNKDHG